MNDLKQFVKALSYLKTVFLAPSKVSISFIDRYEFRESNDTHFKKYWAIPEKNLKSIFDTNFIVYRNDSRNPACE
jgi:hypothetical protein